jgi:hypothetical protein
MLTERSKKWWFVILMLGLSLWWGLYELVSWAVGNLCCSWF